MPWCLHYPHIDQPMKKTSRRCATVLIVAIVWFGYACAMTLPVDGHLQLWSGARPAGSRTQSAGRRLLQASSTPPPSEKEAEVVLLHTEPAAASESIPLESPRGHHTPPSLLRSMSTSPSPAARQTASADTAPATEPRDQEALQPAASTTPLPLIPASTHIPAALAARAAAETSNSTADITITPPGSNATTTPQSAPTQWTTACSQTAMQLALLLVNATALDVQSARFTGNCSSAATLHLAPGEHALAASMPDSVVLSTGKHVFLRA
jgi:hypothetical protein